MQKVNNPWEFPGLPVEGLAVFTAVDLVSIPDQGAKIPQATWHGRPYLSLLMFSVMVMWYLIFFPLLLGIIGTITVHRHLRCHHLNQANA